MSVKISDVLKRFARDEDTDDEEILLQDRKTLLPITKAQKYQFKLAYRVVAGENCNSLPADKVYDVYQAMGYTFQEDEIERFLDSCDPDYNGGYSMESLLEPFEMWLGEQFKTNEFSAVFQSLINEQKVPPNFPTHLLQSEITGDMRISVDPVLRNCINKLIGKTGEDDDTVSLQETRGLFNEIATTDEPGLSFEDFVGIFKQ